MPSTFNVNRADGYEQLMGRWSRRLAVPFIEFAGVEDGDRVVDVGCGTGSLTFALPGAANVAKIAAVDLSPTFVEAAKRRNSDPRIEIQEADACALPFEDGGFDRALSLLVLHFVAEPAKAVSEMRRVVRPGGTVAAAVWDHLGGLPVMRMMWDTLAVTGEQGAGGAGPLPVAADDAAGRDAAVFPGRGAPRGGGAIAADPHGLRLVRRLLAADRQRGRPAGQVRGRDSRVLNAARPMRRCGLHTRAAGRTGPARSPPWPGPAAASCPGEA